MPGPHDLRRMPMGVPLIGGQANVGQPNVIPSAREILTANRDSHRKMADIYDAQIKMMDENPVIEEWLQLARDGQ